MNVFSKFNTLIRYSRTFAIFDYNSFSSFRNQSKKYSSIVKKFSNAAEDDFDTKSEGYEWDSWTTRISNAFNKKLSLHFLRNPLIRFTMVLDDTNADKANERVDFILGVYNESQSSNLLKEVFLGFPYISNQSFMTSTNSTHHVSHLAHYRKVTGNDFFNTNTILEWGGGYGNMARIIKNANPLITYIIVDLPELLAIQSIYLSSLGYKINMILNKNDNVLAGAINLVSSETLIKHDIKVQIDSFISTWAISECPEYLQQYVVDSNFFCAKKLLIASFLDANNKMQSLVDKYEVKKIPVPFLSGSHEYWIG